MEVKALKSKVDKHDDSPRSLESSNCDLKEGTCMSFLEQDKEELYRLNYEMKEEILDIKTRSMRDNLLFGGISRVLRTNEERREFEDTESVLKDFIVKEMDIHGQISFERVHRLGKPRNGKPPFIVAKFSSHKQRELVQRKAATVLRNQENFSVFEQFPKEIQERRKILIPKLKAAKRNRQNAKLVVDKLYIDGQLYDPESDMDYYGRRDFQPNYDTRFDAQHTDRAGEASNSG